MRQRNPRAALTLPGTLRVALVAAYVLYGASVAFLVWSPSAATPSAAVVRLADVATRLGVGVSTSATEFGLNVLMLVPFSLIGGLLIPRLRVTDWVALGFGLSLMVETVQRLLLPRSGSSRDVVANTLGSALGAIAVALTLALLARRSRERVDAEGESGVTS